jgi:Type II CAAX prenyl endopeptidase Rce1-like
MSTDKWRREAGRAARRSGLVPTDAGERLLFTAVAVSAGVCEEIVFRGFGVAYARWLIPGVSNQLLIVMIGILFGYVHYPQGREAIVFSSATGALFTWVTLATGSLIPAMIVHSLLDFRLVLCRRSGSHIGAEARTRNSGGRTGRARVGACSSGSRYRLTFGGRTSFLEWDSLGIVAIG